MQYKVHNKKQQRIGCFFFYAHADA